MKEFIGLYTSIRWMLGGVFLYAGLTKLLTPQNFATLIDAFGILPESLLMPVAVALPALELVAGIGLLFDINGSLAVVAGLLGLFILILGYAIAMGLDVDCGCFGPEDPEFNAFHGLQWSLLRDLLMLAGVVFMVVWRRYRSIETLGITEIIGKLIHRRKTENG